MGVISDRIWIPLIKKWFKYKMILGCEKLNSPYINVIKVAKTPLISIKNKTHINFVHTDMTYTH